MIEDWRKKDVFTELEKISLPEGLKVYLDKNGRNFKDAGDTKRDFQYSYLAIVDKNNRVKFFKTFNSNCEAKDKSLTYKMLKKYILK